MPARAGIAGLSLVTSAATVPLRGNPKCEDRNPKPPASSITRGRQARQPQWYPVPVLIALVISRHIDHPLLSSY